VEIAILVNNAGITRDNLLLRMKEEEWGCDHGHQSQGGVPLVEGGPARNDEGAARTHRQHRLGRHQRQRGRRTTRRAKAALIGFTKSLAQEVGSRNITVNCVAPGFIDTDMTRALPDAQREKLIERIPLGRLGSPEDVAHAVAFLASREAGYITGATLHVNGGMYMQ
jgi:3-oxoacyl-[acyl-carrier protein] reductase